MDLSLVGRRNPPDRIKNRDRWEIMYTVLNELYEQKKPVSFQRLMYWSRMPYHYHKEFIEQLAKAGIVVVIPFNERMAKQNPGVFSQVVMNTKKVVMLTSKGEQALNTLKKMREMNPVKHVNG